MRYESAVIIRGRKLVFAGIDLLVSVSKSCEELKEDGIIDKARLL
jgi:hypothetical protein